MTTESKKIIRESIVEHLVKAHTQLPGFIVNKMSKLNVDIARHDWPHFYHDFLSNILEVRYCLLRHDILYPNLCK